MKSPLRFFTRITLLLITTVISNDIYSQSCNNNISNLHVRNTNTISLYKTWNIYLYKPTFYKVPSLYTLSGTDTVNISNTCATWSVADPAIASISNGVVTAQNSGNTTLTASINGQSVSIPLQIKFEVRPVEYQSSIDPFLTTPAANSISQVPVVVICFIPTNDGVNINTNEAAFSPIPSQTVDELKKHILKISKHTKFSLEEGSKFRGYKDPSAIPYVGYKIIDYIYVYEPVPRGFKDPGSSSFFGDYNVIVNRFNGRRYVEELGVKEFWVMGYHNGEIVPVESNMASPTTRDVSNSYQFPDDMPIYSKTYILYNYNFTREGNEATHNHGHQIESMVDYVATQQDGNTDLFRKNFRGYNGTGTEPIGRVGDTHHPPNTTVDYDYYNYTSVESDILDWKPEGGTKTIVNANTWGSVNYNWPQGTTPNVESNWYVFWMQSIPGYNNHIPYSSTREMTNWWEFLSNWDNTTTRIGLYKNAVTTYYPRDAFVDLSLTSNWTTDAGVGSSGSSPANFTSANQIFNIRIAGIYRASLFVRAPWTVSGGSKVVLNHSYGLIFAPSARLNIGAGSEVNFNNYSVTLNSDATGTASIGTISGTLLNATNVTTERLIPARRAWRMINSTAASTQSINAAWQQGATTASSNPNPLPGFGTHITGGSVAQGFDQNLANSPSIKIYDNATNSWLPLPNTNATSVSSNVFMLFVRGDRSIDLTQGSAATPTNTVLRATGSLRTGDQTFTVNANNFTPIPNPYPSAVNFATITKNNMQNSFYVWDPKMSGPNGVGAFINVSFNGSSYDVTPTPASPINEYIQSHQSFMVRSTGAAGSLVIKETDKSTANTPNVFRTSNVLQSMRVNLMVNNSNNTASVADGVLSSYSANFSNAIDDMDVVKMTNFNENIGIVRNGETLTVERRSAISTSDTIFLKLWNTVQKSYQLQFDPANFSTSAIAAYLVDKYLNTSTPINMSSVSTVGFTVTADAASAAADRFMVVFKANSTLPVNFTTVSAYQQSANIQVDWNVATESNILNYEVEKSSNGVMFTKAGAVAAKANNNAAVAYNWTDVAPYAGNNYYRIKAVTLTGDARYTEVVNVKTGKGRSEITAYPNPIGDRTINLQFVNQPAGIYTAELINNIGQVIFRSQIKHTGGSATQPLQLNNKPAKGVYQLKVSNGDTKKTIQITSN